MWLVNRLVGGRRALTLGRGASLRAARVADLPLAAVLAGLAACTCLRGAALRGAGLFEVDFFEPVLLEAFWLEAALLEVFLLAAWLDADWPGAAFVDVLRAT